MPNPVLHGKKLWGYAPMQRVMSMDAQLIEEQRRCPGCPNGDTDRLARRQFHSPWRWVVVGYMCNRCGSVWISKDTHV